MAEIFMIDFKRKIQSSTVLQRLFTVRLDHTHIRKLLDQLLAVDNVELDEQFLHHGLRLLLACSKHPVLTSHLLPRHAGHGCRFDTVLNVAMFTLPSSAQEDFVVKSIARLDKTLFCSGTFAPARSSCVERLQVLVQTSP